MTHGSGTSGGSAPEDNQLPEFDASTHLGEGPPCDSLIRRQLGNYIVEDLLGRGGFGSVYRAWDMKLDRPAAIKFLKDPLNAENRELFEREAKAIAQLSEHPAIVQIHEWGEHEKYIYFVLEYLPCSAKQLLEACPDGLRVDEALYIAEQGAAALAHAHEKGMLHRDVKPENLLVDQETERVKLADFGLVSLSERSGASLLEGRISGTPAYMSPEQAMAQPLDARTDIYSLGVTLYRLLSNALPIEATTSGEMLQKLRDNESVPLSDRRPDLPDEVLGIVRNAIAHAKEDRYESAGVMREEIAKARQSLAAAAPEVTRRRLPWRTGSLAAIAVALIIGMTTYYQNSPAPSDDAAHPGSLETVGHKVGDLLNAGKFAEAAQRYSTLRVQEQNDGLAAYGYGYALLLQGEHAAAAEVFGQIEDAQLRAEGLAAAAAAQAGPGKGAQSAGALETPYGRVLQAQTRLAQDEPEAVADLLEQFHEEDFPYFWQYAQARKLLGQAYYRLGRYDEAKAVFASLADPDGQAVWPSVRFLAGNYVDTLERRLDKELRQENLERAQALGERIRSGEIPALSNEDLWTSRPLRFIVLPPEVNGGRFAHVSGLRDLLPDLLGRALEDAGPYEWVDRDELDVVLAEQTLSSHLSQGGGRTLLGRLLGARVLIEAQFYSLLGEETLTGKVVDVETTERFTVEEIGVAARSDPREVVHRLAAGVAETLGEAYPRKARLRRDGKALYINIGSNTGVVPGMRFYLTQSPEARAPVLKDTELLVGEDVRGNEARVRLESPALEPEAIPAEGWCAIEAGWRDKYAG